MDIKKRSGFSYFELIVAIVVMGIISTAFPVLLATITRGIQASWKEKAFFNEFTLLGLIVQNSAFDENTTDQVQYYIKCDGDDELLPGNRIGKESQLKNFAVGRLPLDTKSCSLLGVDPGENPSDSSTFDDVDDFNGYSEVIEGQGKVTMNVEVFYANDIDLYRGGEIFTFQFGSDYNKTTHSTNIKIIRITATNGDGSILLTYPVFNIGASKFLGLNEI
jgi:hypothetical protein